MFVASLILIPGTLQISVNEADFILLSELKWLRRIFFFANPIPSILSSAEYLMVLFFFFLLLRIANLCDSSLICCKRLKPGLLIGISRMPCSDNIVSVALTL